MKRSLTENPGIDCVIQFAAYKAVGESVSKPIEYYSNNLNCTLNILDVMRRYDCHNIIFSSSATVYGDPASVPIREDFPVGATTNPYGTTKVFTERILTDCCKADPELNVALLRYFNPIGAHPSGKIGEDPNGIPNNLVPYIAKVAVGKLEKVHVYGNDYPTPDAPACATTSTSWTWPAAMWQPSKSWKKSPACSSATWAPATATVCWM